MSIQKTFDKWISTHFCGLSAHTLYQFLCEYWSYSEADEEINNLVYADLYKVFNKSASDKERRKVFNLILCPLYKTDWIQSPFWDIVECQKRIF